MHGWRGYGLFALENLFSMHLSTLLDILYGESSSKITVRSLVSD